MHELIQTNNWNYQFIGNSHLMLGTNPLVGEKLWRDSPPHFNQLLIFLEGNQTRMHHSHCTMSDLGFEAFTNRNLRWGSDGETPAKSHCLTPRVVLHLPNPSTQIAGLPNMMILGCLHQHELPQKKGTCMVSSSKSSSDASPWLLRKQPARSTIVVPAKVA